MYCTYAYAYAYLAAQHACVLPWNYWLVLVHSAEICCHWVRAPFPLEWSTEGAEADDPCHVDRSGGERCNYPNEACDGFAFAFAFALAVLFCLPAGAGAGRRCDSVGVTTTHATLHRLANRTAKLP